MVLEKNWRKLLLTREDLKRITTKIVREKTRNIKKYPKGYKEVQVYFVDNRKVNGGIKQAENELKQKIWEAKRTAEWKKNHGGFFK